MNTCSGCSIGKLARTPRRGVEQPEQISGPGERYEDQQRAEGVGDAPQQPIELEDVEVERVG